MDRSASFPSLSAPLISKRRQMYSSIYKWFHSDIAEEGPKLDVSEIVLLLQALGFKLECFEKSEILPCKSLRVDVSCEKSNMRAILVYPHSYECKCPSKEEHNKGEFWEVSGTGPSASQESLNKINESGCSLLPPVPQATSQVVKDMMTYLLKLLKDPSEKNNSFNTSNISVQMMATSPASSSNNLNGHSTSRRMSLDSSFLSTISKKSEFKLPKEVKAESIKTESFLSLPHQKIWDIDDEKEVSPPQRTSSPVPQLCNSLEQISLNVNKTSDLIGVLNNARESIEQALKLMSNEPVKPQTVPAKSSMSSAQRSSIVMRQYLSPGNTLRSSYYLMNSSPARSKLLTPKLPQSAKKITNSPLTRKVSMSPLNQNNSIKKPGKLTPFKWKSPAGNEQTFVKEQRVLRPGTPNRAGSSSSGSRESLTKSLSRPIINVKRRISPEANNKSSFASTNTTNSAKKNTSISSRSLVSNKNLASSAKKPTGSSKIAKPIRGGVPHPSANGNDTHNN